MVLTMAALSLGPLQPKAQAIIANQCIDQANYYINNMVKPLPTDPLAHEKCDILLNNCLELCTCRNTTDRTACQLACHSAYDYPTHCP